jgi:uncharacterized membrane protein
MAFFVGGQLVLAAAVVPPLRGDEQNREKIRAVARRFGWGSLISLVVLVATGAMMAGHYELWSDTKLNVKMTLVIITGLLIFLHMRRPQQHWIEGLVFLLSLVILYLGVAMAVAF